MAVLKLAERSIKHFVQLDITNSFTGGTTAFTVETGQGNRCPTVPFALVLFDTRFSNPADAYWQGDAEVVLCTARTGDSLTLVRGIEGTTAISSVGGRKYRLFLDATSGFLENVPRYLNVKAYGAKGDGATDDTTAILDALADLPTFGGVIFFPRSSGAYLLTQNTTITDRFKVTKGHFALIGERGAIIKGAAGADHTMPLIKIWGQLGAPITDILIQGLEFDGNRQNATLGGGTQSHIIDLLNCERVVIRDCYMHDSPGDFVRTNLESDTQPIRDLFVLQNRMDTCLRNAVSLVLCERAVIDGNLITGFNTMGVDCEPNGTDDPCHDIVISNNRMSPSSTVLNSFNTNRFAGIQCKGTAGHDNVAHVRIVGNYVEGLQDGASWFPSFGINVDKFRSVTINGNQIVRVRQGISAGGSDGSDTGDGGTGTSSTGTISGNIIKQCKSSTSGYGILARTGWTISGNICEENDGQGIWVSGRSCTIVGNLCQNNGRDGADSSGHRLVGIHLAGEDCLVVGNRCRDTQASKTQKYGAYLEDGAADNIIAENNFLDNDTLGIFVQPTGLNGNRVRFNLGYVTENGGNGSIASGTTSVPITHGLDRTPSPLDITITQRDDSTNDPGDVWITALGATTFTVNIRNDPGAGGWDFAWAVRPRH